MREFTILKFRTMRVDPDAGTHRDYVRRSMSINAIAAPNGLYKLDRSDSVTRVGRRLRKTSLDELPQLLNVPKDDMSLVGPAVHPLRSRELRCPSSRSVDLFLMPQGLTGLWRITAHANSSYLEALDLDVAYVRDWSLRLDLRPLSALRSRSFAGESRGRSLSSALSAGRRQRAASRGTVQPNERPGARLDYCAIVRSRGSCASPHGRGGANESTFCARRSRTTWGLP